MPSASVAENSVIVPDVKCSGCGNPIIKDGQFKCLRCRPKRLVPATLGKQNIVCPRHDTPVVLMRYDHKSGQYRAYCQKSGCPNRKEKIGTPIPTEDQMTQEAITEKAPSKTQELRGWLDGEIKRTIENCLILYAAISSSKRGSIPDALSLIGSILSDPMFHERIAPELFIQEGRLRYTGKTSSQKEAAIKEDSDELEKIRKRLELLRSARELDVDVDAVEKALPEWEISLRMVQVTQMSQNPLIEAKIRQNSSLCVKSFQIDLLRGRLTMGSSSCPTDVGSMNSRFIGFKNIKAYPATSTGEVDFLFSCQMVSLGNSGYMRITHK